MFDFKLSYKNPLAARIAESASLLESFATELIQKKQPRLMQVGKKLFRTMYPIFDLVDGISELLKQKGMQGEGSPEEKAAQLLISLIEDVHQFTSEYRNERLNTNDKLPTIYEEPIDRADVIDVVEESVKVMDLFKDVIKNPDLAEILRIAVPENFECESTDELERLKEFISSYQKTIKNRVNEDIPEYMFQLMGEYWDVRFGGKIYHIKDLKGMRYIHILLQKPSKPIRADVLAPAVEKAEAAEGLIDNTDIPDEGEPSVHDVNVVRETGARGEYKMYKSALADSKVELKTLKKNSRNYAVKAQKVKNLEKFISKTFDRSGNERQTFDTGEKSRQAVRKAIKRDLKRISNSSPKLGKHFQDHLKTGFECIYNPPPKSLPDWHL